MLRKLHVFLFSILALLSSCNKEQRKMNVLLIIMDDQNDWTGFNKGEKIETPSLDILSKSSINFTQAYCSAPGCTPSRTSFLTGLSPSTTGAYYNNQSYRKSETWVSEVVNLPQLFKSQGYLTAGYGKVFHHVGENQELDKDSWTKGYYQPFDVNEDFALKKHANNIQGISNRYYHWGRLPDDWDKEDTLLMQQDTKNTNRAIRLLTKHRDRPFFMALGLWKPHTPWYLPGRYFDAYDTASMHIPEGYLANDLEDVPAPGRWLATERGYHQEMVNNGLWKSAIQAYKASVTYSDEQVGRVLEALEKSEYRDNTIVILIGDNGWHLGEKDHWSKFTLWEQAAKVPFLLKIPGYKPQEIETPVSLLDIFPTFQELCHLPDPPTHTPEGHNLLPLVRGEESNSYALTTHGKGNHSLRTKQYRYIHYSNGSEELYDHLEDPYEWKNLANSDEYGGLKDSLAQYFPIEEAQNIIFDGGNESSFGWDKTDFPVKN